MHARSQNRFELVLFIFFSCDPQTTSNAEPPPPTGASFARTLPAAGPRRLVSATSKPATSVAMLVQEETEDGPQLSCDASTCRIYDRSKVLNEKLGYCDHSKRYCDEAADQPLLGPRTCAAVLVGEKYLVTAKHCCNDDRGRAQRTCDGDRVLFDYFSPRTGNNAESAKMEYPAFAVEDWERVEGSSRSYRDDSRAGANSEDSGKFSCARQEAQTRTNWQNGEYSPRNLKKDELIVLRLDRSPMRSPIACSASAVHKGEPVVSLGFPDNAPLSLAGPGAIVGNRDGLLTLTLRHNDGNSGGPILAAHSRKLIGIALGGGDGYTPCSAEGGTNCHTDLACNRAHCDKAYGVTVTEGLCSEIDEAIKRLEGRAEDPNQRSESKGQHKHAERRHEEL